MSNYPCSSLSCDNFISSGNYCITCFDESKKTQPLKEEPKKTQEGIKSRFGFKINHRREKFPSSMTGNCNSILNIAVFFIFLKVIIHGYSIGESHLSNSDSQPQAKQVTPYIKYLEGYTSVLSETSRSILKQGTSALPINKQSKGRSKLSDKDLFLHIQLTNKMVNSSNTYCLMEAGAQLRDTRKVVEEGIGKLQHEEAFLYGIIQGKAFNHFVENNFDIEISSLEENQIFQIADEANLKYGEGAWDKIINSFQNSSASSTVKCSNVKKFYAILSDKSSNKTAKMNLIRSIYSSI